MRAFLFFFFFNDTATTEIYTLSLHDALPISPAAAAELRERAARLVLAPMLRKLRHDHGVRTVLCEGGPVLNGGLLREGLVDELFLSVAPKLAGDAGPTVASGAPPDGPAWMALP